MKTRQWLVVALAALLAMAMLAPTGSAQAKKAKPKSGATKVEQGMPAGCGMKGGAAKGAAAGKPGCGMEKGMGAGMSGCGMHGGGMKGGGMGAGMGCCGMSSMAGGPRGGCGMGGPGMGRGMGAGMCGPGMGLGCGPGMMRELGLSADQQKKIAEVCGRHQKQMIQSQADVQVAMVDLRQLARAETPDRAKLDAQIDKLSALRATMAKARVGALLEVRSMLTPDQLKKWQAGPMGDEEEGEED